MIIGTAEILIGIFIIVISCIAYSIIKQLRTLEKSQARRILDIMVIGAILYWLNIFTPREFGGQTFIFTTAGMLIFLYGYVLLLIEKFREGRREAQL